MKTTFISKIVLILMIASLSLTSVAGGEGSDKFYLLYGSRAYELKEFKNGIIAGISVDASPRISKARAAQLTKEYRETLSKYLDKILLLSSRHKVDPVLVVSTIWVESCFNPKATSPVGAKGFMQVMPKTNKWIFGSLLKKNLSKMEESLEEQNLEAGIAYLSHLKETFNNDKEKMMIAYNMGPKYVLMRSNFKFNHDYYRKISNKFNKISNKLERRGTYSRHSFASR